MEVNLHTLKSAQPVDAECGISAVFAEIVFKVRPAEKWKFSLLPKSISANMILPSAGFEIESCHIGMYSNQHFLRHCCILPLFNVFIYTGESFSKDESSTRETPLIYEKYFWIMFAKILKRLTETSWIIIDYRECIHKNM